MFDPQGMKQVVVVRDPPRKRWLLFRNPRRILSALTIPEVLPQLARIENAVDHDGCWAAGFVAYDAAPAFDPALTVKSDGAFPLLWFGMYDQPEPIVLPQADTDPAPVWPQWLPSINANGYGEAIQTIKEHIRHGDTYQVNFTFRLRATIHEDPWLLFCRLTHAHIPAHGAFVAADDWSVCSLSPELFFSLQDAELVCQPMKGTADRGLTFADDESRARQLQNCPKNRAENVMIVDMVRNDLGRVARPGSVRATDLFAPEKHSTLWQMTSTVQARTEARFSEILRALFPPASITGAPKPQTMRIIADLESTPRHLYTGCIGFLGPGRNSRFNVAIRTLTINSNSREAEYGVGGGITWDSVTGAELDEAFAKARTILEPSPDFALMETMLWTPEAGYHLLDLHLDRLRESAAYYSFPFHQPTLLDELETLARGFPCASQRIRLLLDRDGRISCSSTPFQKAPATRPKRVRLAKAPVKSSSHFLYHKTTHRQIYEEALAACPGYDDVLLWNEQGELTESCIANLVIELDGQNYTPPVRCGLLAGTYRAWMLREGLVREKVLPIEILPRAVHVYLVNSVRGQEEVLVDIQKGGPP
ncbi:MAG: chorismate-binding protein [Verrucomicrobia bacterium]|nr:chorismate-binding protein [Verrucomicrobiota bacterium]